MKARDLNLDDIESALYAMESWLDAFGDDPDLTGDAARVRKTADAFREIAEVMRAAGTLALSPRKEVH